MAGNSALGGFVEGLQGGISHRRQTLRDKKIDRALDQQNKLGAMAIEGKQMDINRVRAEKGLSPRDFTQFEANQDPYGFKLGDFFKPKKLWQNFKDNAGIGGGSMDNPASPVQANEAAIQSLDDGSIGSSVGMPGNTDNMNLLYSADGGPVRKMANGGTVRPDYIRASERIAGGGRTAANAPGLRGAIPRYVAQQGGARNLLNSSKMVKGGGALAAGMSIADQTADDYDERVLGERFGNFEGTPLYIPEDERGEGGIGNFLKYAGQRAIGFASDLGDNLTMGIAGRAYRDADQPEQAAAIAASDVVRPEPEPEQAPTAAQPAPTPRAAVQPPAAPQAPEVTGGPNQLADAPITDPGEMPTMNTEEWVAYRAASVESMLMQGMTLPEAHDAVTTMQQKGFLNYGTQALQMLAAGDPARAAMALKAAYQYFPNGADVRFGITKDKQGQPALVAMGTNEQTGESTGAPMLITGERLAVMMENMTNPDAFRTWTKDWREFEQDLRKYYEMEKPQAESENIYRDRMGRAALNRSEADLIGAMGAGSGGFKRTDLDRNSKEFRTALGEMGLLEGIPRPDQTYLTRIMSALVLYHGMEQNEVIDEVMAAYDSQAIPQLLDRYGLSDAESGE